MNRTPAALIEVSTREGFSDSAASGVLSLAKELGVPVEKAATVALYRLEGDLDRAALTKLASELLTDPVTETYEIVPSPQPSPASGRGSSSISNSVPLERNSLAPRERGEGRGEGQSLPCLTLDIWLKPQVADPVAPSIERGAKDLGFSLKARIGRRYRLFGPLNAEAAKTVAWKALANPVVHECEVR